MFNPRQQSLIYSQSTAYIELGYKRIKIDLPSSDEDRSSAGSSRSGSPSSHSSSQPPPPPPPAPGNYEAYLAKKEKYKREYHPKVEPKREEPVGLVSASAVREYYKRLGMHISTSWAAVPCYVIHANRVGCLVPAYDDPCWHYSFDPDTLERYYDPRSRGPEWLKLLQ